MLTVLDGSYPERLRGVHQAPPVLFARGSVLPCDRAVSVVGSRNASERGLEIAANIAGELVARDVTVVAGLAVGIDTAANRALHEEIASAGGYLRNPVRQNRVTCAVCTTPVDGRCPLC